MAVVLFRACLARFVRAGLGMALALSPALAQADQLDSGDTAWMLTATALVLFMTLPGLALFYGGLVRTKNVLSILMQVFAIACVASVLWFVVGYTMAFGPGGSAWLGGFSKTMLSGVGVDALSGTYPETVFVMFQMTFAMITPALIIGAFAERMRFSAMLMFSSAWLLLVYAPVTYWVWGGGWLAQRGFMDFAGGGVVHVNAGVAALVGALYLGKRKGFPLTPMPPHNLTMTVTGACMLWVGWFGFNAGSALAADGNAGMAMLVTHLGAAAGSIAWMCMEWLRFGKPSVLGIVTGMVAGLGTITPASGFVGPAGALIIGLSAGFVCFWATQVVKRNFQIDDSLDVFPVHGVGGFLGLLMTAFFANRLGGLGFVNESIETSGQQLFEQALGAGAIALWCGVVTLVLFKLIDLLVGVRVSEEDETIGLDLTQHDERGYTN
jgi:Amt family ammonium transporter